MQPLTRRHFLGGLAGTAVASSLLPSASVAAVVEQPHTIFVPPGAPAPLETAAHELAHHTGGKIERRDHASPLHSGEVALVLGTDARRYAELAARLTVETLAREWELVARSGEGLVFAGATPRNVCRAVLGWITDPVRELNRLSLYCFAERRTRWDNSMNQMYRFSRGFDLERHVREIARLGHTGIEINRYADLGGYHVRHRKFPDDSYAWFMSYCPALDAFFESSLTRGIYRPEELAANLADLKNNAALARRYGLAPGFVCYEPRGVAEEIFDRHPGLRGARIDHPGRSLQPRYSLDIANPRVLAHYAELMTQLLEAVPDLGYFVFYTQDSGSGIPFASRLYAGPNGSYLARSKTIAQLTADFTRTLLEAGRKTNPHLDVIMEFTHVYTDEEAQSIREHQPRGVGHSYPLAGFLARTPDSPGPIAESIAADRAAGVEPSANLIVSAGWDAEPIIGVPAPRALAKKFALLRPFALRSIFTNGGLFSPPQCPWSINQELFAELIREENVDVDAFLLRTARLWCGGDNSHADLLALAWKTGDEAMAVMPSLGGYVPASIRIQRRGLIRPVVPDITRLTAAERAPYERVLFPLSWDIARVNIVFDGGIRLQEEAAMDRGVKEFDEAMVPRLARAVEILDGALARGSAPPVMLDQRDRYRGFLLCIRTDRNLHAAQSAINHTLLRDGSRETHRANLRRAMEAEIANTREWLRAFAETKTNFFHLTSGEETAFFYKTPVEDLTVKLRAMEAHLDDEPGPYLPELENRKRAKLQFRG